MDRFTRMQVFIAVAEEKGFAAASRRLGISPPVVTRAVAELEAHLGVQLFVRSTRHVNATDAGRRFLTDARQILEELQLAEESAAGINAEPAGQLTVTASVMFGQCFVTPTILRYLQQYPDTGVNAVFLDRVVNLLEEGIDVGVRIAHLADSSMRALRVGQVRHQLVASPDYLERYGIPMAITDLDAHTTISATGSSVSPGWQFSQGRSYRPRARLSANDNRAVLESVRGGFGIARLISYQVAEDLEKGALQTVLSDCEPEPVPVHIVHRETRLGSCKVRAFVDMLAEDLRSNRALQ